VKNSIKKWYQVVIEPYIKDTRTSIQSYRYGRETTVLLAIVLLAFAGFWGYRWWHRQRESAAQKSFSECLYAYQEASQGKDESWSNVAMLFNLGYEQHQSSSLAPYFLVFHADALLKQGKREDALSKLDEAIKKLPADSPVLSLYKTKLALVQLDDEDKAVSEAGCVALKALAENKENEDRDMALYYIGLYYWTQNNIKEAQAIWQQLVDAFKHEKIGASPWAILARTKLEQIA